MSEFIQLMARTAMNKGVFLSDLEQLYKVKPEIREKLQDFIELLKNRNDENKAIANIAAAKAQVSNSIFNLLEKSELGKDMLQLAESYENVGQKEISVKMYIGIMNDFESDSIKSSSGLFPEISQVDTRPAEEILIFKTAKDSFERLTGEKIEEPKRVHIDNNENAKTIVEKMTAEQKEVTEKDYVEEKIESTGFFNKLINVFKKN